jgi:hypothetical protein
MGRTPLSNHGAGWPMCARWVAENVITYDGKPMHAVNILEFRDGKVTHETI